MKQTTFCYCPTCKNELCSNGELISDIQGTVIYKCPQCGMLSSWDFNAPVPLLRSVEEDGVFEG